MAKQALWVGLALTVAFPAGAQVELGFDAGQTLASGKDEEDVTSVDIPGVSFRVGIDLSSRVQLQMTSSLTSLSFLPGVLVSVWEDYRVEGGLFFIADFGFAQARNERIDVSVTALRVGGGGGWRVPVTDTVAWRGLLRLGYSAETAWTSSYSFFGVQTGLSFYPWSVGG